VLGCMPRSIMSEREEIALTPLLLCGCAWNRTRISKQPDYKKDITKLEGTENTAVKMIKS